jgi:hypothetical protein
MADGASENRSAGTTEDKMTVPVKSEGDVRQIAEQPAKPLKLQPVSSNKRTQASAENKNDGIAESAVSIRCEMAAKRHSMLSVMR